ncbi:MAG: autotransporter outer membrane beta-barrel domain-containing protein [Mesorhizobium sp.]|nr:MAG: autotransporter outer membrane beta-barrel domain-containing protein [Mesorhizobium sp.]TIV28280.1 MAG: autotransporter outer membrane beta-barrel domain-containing protein [Mesorhizobium sp.]
MAATARGFLGWRHAFGDAAPTIGVAFAGQDPFTIARTPIVRDAALIDLGLDIQTSAAARLGISYFGQFGGGTTSQAFKAGLHVAF